MCLNSIGAPLQLIGYAINYIWETLAEGRLDMDTSGIVCLITVLHLTTTYCSFRFFLVF